MAKGSEALASAFVAGGRGTANNSVTDGSVLLLHGHRVAWRGYADHGAVVCLSLCGHDTMTTRDRLYAVLWALVVNPRGVSGVGCRVRFGPLGGGVVCVDGVDTAMDSVGDVLAVPVVWAGADWLVDDDRPIRVVASKYAPRPELV